MTKAGDAMKRQSDMAWMIEYGMVGAMAIAVFIIGLIHTF
jgi:Flp pilus assembly pilin Flp